MRKVSVSVPSTSNTTSFLPTAPPSSFSRSLLAAFSRTPWLTHSGMSGYSGAGDADRGLQVLSRLDGPTRSILRPRRNHHQDHVTPPSARRWRGAGGRGGRPSAPLPG